MLPKRRRRRLRCRFGHCHTGQWVRLPAWGFLLEFYNAVALKCAVVELARGMKQTDRQTNRQTDRSHRRSNAQSLSGRLVTIRLRNILGYATRVGFTLPTPPKCTTWLDDVTADCQHSSSSGQTLAPPVVGVENQPLFQSAAVVAVRGGRVEKCPAAEVPPVPSFTDTFAIDWLIYLFID